LQVNALNIYNTHFAQQTWRAGNEAS